MAPELCLRKNMCNLAVLAQTAWINLAMKVLGGSREF